MEPCSETFSFRDDSEDVRYEVTVLDMPGLVDDAFVAGGHEQMLDQLVELIEHSPAAVHRIFYVTKLRPVRGEEIRCLEALRGVLSDEACDEGICSVVVTHCDWLDDREEMVDELYVQPALGRFTGMFRPDSRDRPEIPKPEIIPSDLSCGSSSERTDCAKLMASICEARAPLAKTRLFRSCTGGKASAGPAALRMALREHLLPELA